MMRRQHHATAAQRAGVAQILQRGHRRGIDKEGRGSGGAQQGLDKSAGGSLVHHARTHRDAVGGVQAVGQGRRRFPLDAPRSGAGHGDHPRLGNGEAEGHCLLLTRGELELARSRPQGRHAAEDGGPGKLGVAADHQQAPARVLVARVVRHRQGQGLEGAEIEFDR